MTRKEMIKDPEIVGLLRYFYIRLDRAGQFSECITPNFGEFMELFKDRINTPPGIPMDDILADAKLKGAKIVPVHWYAEELPGYKITYKP